MSGRQRPFKVWNAPRNVKKSVTAATLEELIRKGKEKLRYEHEDITLVLESDGTEVDDEEYFHFLDEQTTFVFLTAHDDWIPACEDEIVCEDVTDTGASQLGSEVTDDDDSRSVSELGNMLKKDFAMIHTLSREEIQKLLDLSADDLGTRLGRSRRDAHHIQLSCQRHLDQMRDSDDAVQFLELLKNRVLPGNSAAAVDAESVGPSMKRNRLSDT